MSRNSHGRKPKPRRPGDDDPGRRIHDERRAYKRPHGPEWQQPLEDEEVEELEDLDELSELEDSEFDALEELVEPDEEEHS
ncbi:MAG: hypothetical protein JW889_06480 [Verrucomicrobia bacterium]|nr:hypothetical protein [Verrucomicrobiota bacterium]